MSAALPRPASTVALLRQGAADLEVLLVRRHDRIAFMGGAHVFPGGRVEEEDLRSAGDDVPVDARLIADVGAESARGFYVAAARELTEEAGIAVPITGLVYFAHWVTPEIETRRYDTRFFLAAAPAGQVARHDDGEMTESLWLTPRDAIARCRRAEIALPPPTWTTLRWLEDFADVHEALAWARRKPVPRVQPGFIQDGETRIVTLPGDATVPAVPGFTARETRFILSAGHWRPVAE